MVVLAVLLVVYAVLVFAFQYASLTRQMLHDEVQDVVTVEGLLYFDGQGALQLRQDYYSRPQSHLLVDRMMEVRDQATDQVLYRSPTLHDMALGGALRAGEGDKDFSEQLVRLGDGTHVFVVSHVHGMNGRQMVIRLGYDLGPLRERMIQFLLLLSLGIPLALAIAGLAGQMIAKRALRPLESMTQHAENITASNLNDRLDVMDADTELGHMATVFNGLLQRLEEAFTQLQRFTADAAHELRTPLASLRAVGEIALQEPRTAESYRNTLSDILEETGRLSETINSLLLLSRAEVMQPGQQQTDFSVQSLVNEVLELLDVLIEERAIRVIAEGKLHDIVVTADRSLLRVAIMNVLHNAVKFSPKESTLRIQYTTVEGGQLRLSVQDEGPGLAGDDHERVFDRFYTSGDIDGKAQAGVGLGLAIAKLIIERSGGEIWFEQGVAIGACCVIVLTSNL
jgi:heavy metal sensor kinase